MPVFLLNVCFIIDLIILSIFVSHIYYYKAITHILKIWHKCPTYKRKTKSTNLCCNLHANGRQPVIDQTHQNSSGSTFSYDSQVNKSNKLFENVNLKFR